MDIFNELKELCLEINSIYASMYNLERFYRKDSDLYFDNVKKLKSKVVEEKKLVSELVNGDDYHLVRDEIFCCDDYDPELIRIKDNLVSYESTNIDIYEDDDEEIVNMKRLSMNAGKCYEITAKNIFLLFLYFLQNEIDTEKKSELRDRLLKLKYYNCFVKHIMEATMLCHDFNIPKECYLDLDLSIELLNVSEDLSNKIVLDSYMTSINNVFEQILAKSDYEYKNNDNSYSMKINYICLLKANLIIMNDDQYRLMFDFICNTLREYSSYDNVDSVKDIIEIINQRNDYKKGIKRLSLKPFKN